LPVVVTRALVLLHPRRSRPPAPGPGTSRSMGSVPSANRMSSQQVAVYLEVGTRTHTVRGGRYCIGTKPLVTNYPGLGTRGWGERVWYTSVPAPLSLPDLSSLRALVVPVRTKNPATPVTTSNTIVEFTHPTRPQDTRAPLSVQFKGVHHGVYLGEETRRT
jgi:hypothetical protein